MALIDPGKVERLVRFGLTTPDAGRLSAFYEQAFGARRITRRRRSGLDFEQLMGVRGGADSIVVGLGDETIDLLAFDEPGRPYPEGSSASDTIFQHFAIVVADMASAYDKLSAADGWSPISIGGPQQLPETSGGVTAFKFRDPDGHPLELLAFPSGAAPARWRQATGRAAALGINHSAISVADADASMAFYRDLGCQMSARTLNRGAAQQRLDDVRRPQVDVVAMSPPRPGPHIELLSYLGVDRGFAPPMQANDVAATIMTFEGAFTPAQGPAVPGARRLSDPDGHTLVIASGEGRLAN